MIHVVIERDHSHGQRSVKFGMRGSQYKLKETKLYVSHISQDQVSGPGAQMVVNEVIAVKETSISRSKCNDMLAPTPMVFVSFHTHLILPVVLHVLQARTVKTQRG